VSQPSRLDVPQPTPTLESVAGELRRRRWHLGFEPDIEARFEAETGGARRRHLLLAGLAGLVVYNMFLFNDLVVRPQVLEVALCWRLGVTTLYGLAVLALIRYDLLTPSWREAAAGSCIVVAMVSSCMIFRSTTSPAGNYDPFVFGLIFMAGNIALALRFRVAAVSTALAFGVAVAFVLDQAGMPGEAKLFALGLMLGTGIFTVMACYQVEHATRRFYLLILREELRAETALRSSQTDALTQLANRRSLDATLPLRWEMARKQRRPLAALMVDIDNFKRFNDRFGHRAGDDCLRSVAAAMCANLREGDFIARMGGEEFLVLIDAASIAAIQAAAERLRRGVEQMAIAHDGVAGQAVVTISVGIALTRPGPGTDPASLIEAADAALYEAKRNGRNRWAMATERM
jgi:diguanylate cyclase (GGDEF)-like protein